MNTFWRKLGWLLRRRGKEEELSEELRFHLESEAEERQAEGLDAGEAQWAARRELGNLGRVREETRAAWSWTLVEQLCQDLRYGARTILRNPAFTLLAALSLALGIGANTAIYSCLDAVLMRSLPVADPQSLVVLKWHWPGKKADVDDSVLHNISGQVYDDPKTGSTSAVFPFPAWEALGQSGDVLSTLFAYHPARKLNVMVRGESQVTSGEYVSGNYFAGLGVAPAAGRLIAAEDDRAGAPAVAVLSYGFARARFGDAALAAGQPVTINNVPFTAIGVAAPGFFGVDPAKAPDVFLPFHADLLLDPSRGPGPNSRYLDPNYYWTEMMGRLRPGVTVVQAQAALSRRFAVWVAGTASNEAQRRKLPEFLLQSGSGGLDNLRRNYSQPLFLLLAMVGLILALACANIANLLLARATARRREMAVRLSIGAGRGRVVRQILTENLLLAMLGGAVGIGLAAWGIQVLSTTLGQEGFPLHAEMSAGVLSAALALTAATGLLFGLAPALHATRVDPMPVLKDVRAGGSRTRRRPAAGSMLVIAQMAICLLLLVGAALFVRTLANLHALDAGFQRDHILLFQVNARQVGHADGEMLTFYRNLEQRLAAIPGVRSASMANSPLIGDGAWGWPVVPAGKPLPERAPSGHGSGAARTATRVLGVGPGFFSTMHIPLVAGREFDQRDQTLPVAIVNQAWVKVNFAGGNPVGQHVTSYALHRKPQEMEIIGVAGNARYGDWTGEFPAVVYQPLAPSLGVPIDELTFFLRTAGNPTASAAAAREIVRQADPRIPVAGLTTQAAQIEREMGQETVFARLCTAFALLALAIACVGLYGTTSYAVARRTGEIGIRMALGAPRATVVWMVLRDVLLLALLGLALGLPAAWSASKLVESVLFGVKPGDPWAMGAAVAILLGAALAAGYLPARRASRIDPIRAVRHE